MSETRNITLSYG